MSDLDNYVLSAALSANSAATSAAIIANTVIVTGEYRDQATAQAALAAGYAGDAADSAAAATTNGAVQVALASDEADRAETARIQSEAVYASIRQSLQQPYVALSEIDYFIDKDHPAASDSNAGTSINAPAATRVLGRDRDLPCFVWQ